MDLKDLVPLLNNKPWTYRLKIMQQPLPTEWSNWLIASVESYIEAEKQGPYPVRQIEWIDINPIEMKTTGRLMRTTETDHSDDVINFLKEGSLPGHQEGGVFRIFVSSTHVDPV